MRMVRLYIFFYFWFQVGKEVAHPGVANDFNDDDAQKYYTYYQWVCFVLFFQVWKIAVINNELINKKLKYWIRKLIINFDKLC